EQFVVVGSQGQAPVSAIHSYELSEHGDILTYQVKRSTRTAGPGMRYTLKREGSRNAYFMKLEDNWDIEGKLPEQALLISLQGIANVGGPRLYFIYPPNWPFTYTESVFGFYRDKRYYTFRELKTAAEALDTLKNYLKGYVVWDTSVRTSLIVAFTAAGLEKAVVVTEELIPIAERAGLKPVADFRGKFRGKTDAEIYTWAYQQYWDRCSKDFIIWMGGEHGRIMRPGVADWGINQRAFFNDLSSRTEDTEEYALANTLLKEMHPMSMVMGWHSYAKDRERDHVTLVSRYGHRVEGLHTLPNLSFSSQIVPTEGFEFKNNHTVVPGQEHTPEQKVYISCIQTDGIGIGAWLKPGRGEIPYAWEVLMNYSWMAPAMLEYFYSTATPNDYFIGCLSGPGYMYPKAVPPKLLPGLIGKANDMMKQLDLRVFEIMDYSEGATVEGNTELTRSVADAYYRGMPDAVGFVNGYAPSFTFTNNNGRPLISYDYYLSPTRPEADAVADLEELALVNSSRPYFLLMHVRESSDIKRVKGILDRLSEQFELVPLDRFLKMAGTQPTFKERFLSRTDP
ncbi:MAG: GxGYxYP family putative glycoside hydrolase, partial [Ignavibacteria bacterium]|nr:GxGYxYP family putative glycoside hydrolase [Ignavibacteria bacterium]